MEAVDLAPKRNPKAMRGSRLVINLTLDPDQVEAVDAMADTRRTSRAAIVREALDLFLAVNIARGGNAVSDGTRQAA